MKIKRQIKGKKYTSNLMVTVLLCCLFLMLTGCGATKSTIENESESRTEDIYYYLMASSEVDSMQELVDQVYQVKADSGVTETYIQSLAAKGLSIDYSHYGKALEDALLSEEELTSASLQKACITFWEIGYLNPQEIEWIRQAVSLTGNDSIMSYVYGILLMNELQKGSTMAVSDNLEFPKVSDDEIVAAILALCELQLSDGGFAYQGTEGDVDVTAMTLQALAPWYGKNEQITNSIEEALLFLEKAQFPDGDFASMGNQNCESTAQVILSLNALQIDIDRDVRFQKQGNTVVDGLLKYQLESGGFSHGLAGKENAMATSQALQALTAYELSISKDTLRNNSSKEPSVAFWVHGHIQIVLTAGILLLAIVYALLVAKKSRKKLISEVFVVAVALIVIWCIRIESVDTHRDQQKKDSVELKNPIQVTISIDCSSVLSYEPTNQLTDFSSIIPENGMILSACDVIIEEGSSVYDVLKMVCEEKQIPLDSSEDHLYGTYYVKGIGLLYEFDFGDLSGWMYRVNGSFPSIGAGEYELQEKDVVEWVYTKEMGHDLEGGN